MDKIRCFMLERTDFANESFRRYKSSESGPACPLHPGTYPYHNISAIINLQVEYHSKYDGEGLIPSDELKTDPRWPVACGCGYVFAPEDEWQHNFDRLWRMPDGTLIDPKKAPAGAMWFSPGYEELGDYVGPDGHALMVMLPPGGRASNVWHVDGPARDGGRWTRLGAPPDVTVSPSIATSQYHGFLTQGYLERCG